MSEMKIEQQFERLEEIVEALEGEELSLEEAFNVYQEGMNLLKQCNDQMDQVEKKVLALSADGSLSELDREDEE
ncbi:MAG: exodeoxyribonuclease VII small subunit [Acetatifactor sp.]|nr:exodeoxyribonuclease VII small subunit [Acetatifactor sp.]